MRRDGGSVFPAHAKTGDPWPVGLRRGRTASNAGLLPTFRTAGTDRNYIIVGVPTPIGALSY